MKKPKRQPVSSPNPVGSEGLLLAVDRLMDIVEGVRGERWQASGRRLVDTPEWCDVYAAWCAISRKSPNTKLSGGGVKH